MIINVALKKMPMSLIQKKKKKKKSEQQELAEHGPWCEKTNKTKKHYLACCWVAIQAAFFSPPLFP